MQRCASDGAAWTAERCTDGQVCLAGGCLTLSPPGDATAVERSALYRPVGDRWINAWAIHGSLPKTRIDELSETPALAFQPHDGNVHRSLCQPDGYTRIHKQRYGDRRDERHVLSGYLVTGRARDAVLRVGAEGHVRIWLGDTLAGERDLAHQHPPFRDESLFDVKLRAGLNPVMVIAEQKKKRPTGLWLRVGESDGQLASDVLWTLPHGQHCGLHDLTQIQLLPAAARGGFDVALSLSVTGVAPEGEDSLVYRLWLGGNAKRATELVAGSFTTAALATGQTVVAPARFTKRRRTALGVDVGPPDEPRTRAQPIRYHGEPHERVVALAEIAGALPNELPAPARHSFQHAVGTLMSALAASLPDRRWFVKRSDQLETLGRSLAAGQDAYASARGIIYRAYRSEIDGTIQPYLAYIPDSHRRDGKPLPLIVSFHGLGQKPGLALRTVFGMAPDEDDDRAFATRHLPRLPDLGAIVVAPWGYGDAGQRQLGEHDVLAVIDRMRNDYNVDDSRISLTGYSLGGTVAFTVPLHYPDRFSAAAPLCGYPNLPFWRSIRDAPKQLFEEQMIARRYIGNYAENGLHLPLNIVHGGRDGPRRSALIAKRYRELGYRRVWDLQDELDHNVWDYGYKDGRMIAWLRRQQRPAVPKHVHLRTAERRYDKAYWVRLVEPSGDAATSGAEAPVSDIDAEVDPASKSLRVTTSGVISFAVDRRALEIEHAEVDGTRLVLPAGDVVYFTRSANGFTASASAPQNNIAHKHAGVAGPLDDVLRHRTQIVYGTAHAGEVEANRLVAKHFASFDHWSAAQFPVIADYKLADDDLLGRSLVLVGGPRSNSVTRRLAHHLPVRFESNAIVLRDDRFEGSDVGVSLIYPHPLDHHEYVVLHAGVGYSGTLASRHLPRLAPDFLVYDRGITLARGGELLAPRRVLAGGFFSNTWQ